MGNNKCNSEPSARMVHHRNRNTFGCDRVAGKNGDLMKAEKLQEINCLVLELSTILSEAERCVATLDNLVWPNDLLKQTKKQTDRLGAEVKGLQTKLKDLENEKENEHV